jgi:hypothetical protein
MMLPVHDPALLHTAVSNESNLSTHVYTILQQDDTLPGTLGHVSILQGVKVFPVRVGVPATQWHGCPFASVHDIMACNGPPSLSNSHWMLFTERRGLVLSPPTIRKHSN